MTRTTRHGAKSDSTTCSSITTRRRRRWIRISGNGSAATERVSSMLCFLVVVVAGCAMRQVSSFVVGGGGRFDTASTSKRQCFVSLNHKRQLHHPKQTQQTTSNTQLYMVFDFFKERASEGVQQLGKFSDSAKRGKLGEAFVDVALYTQQTNKAFKEGLAKSRTKFLYDLDNVLNNQGRDYLEDLEMVLLQSDLGIDTTDDILKELKSFRYEGSKFLSKKDLLATIRGKLLESLDVVGDQKLSSSDNDNHQMMLTRNIRFANPSESETNDPKRTLTVLFFMGANGMGKTTTIGKLAHRLREEGGQNVLLAACDTFRAGAVEQLELWAQRAQVDVFVPSDTMKSPSAVLYGALDKALVEGSYDTLLVDTSGRLSNNDDLTRELLKMRNVIQKRMSLETTTVEKEDGSTTTNPVPNVNVPHETLLVIDASQGRMALDSAKQWNDAGIGLSGLILTKLDGSAKGGSVVSVSRQLQLPVKLVGVGEGIDDLKDFDPEMFVDGLLGIGSSSASKTKIGGGSSSAASSGKELDARLKELRKNRDSAAAAAAAAAASKKTISSSGMEMTPCSPIAAMESSSSSPAVPSEFDRLVAANAGRKKKSGNNNNNKKKKKRRK